MNSRSIRVATISGALIATFAACGGAGTGERVIVRDSAGVRLTETKRPRWSSETAWHLSRAPSLEIGVEEGDERYQLFRVYSTTRLEDGTVVVSNSGTSELRWFDPAGRFLTSAGRGGEGPGEFSHYSSMEIWRLGDSALAVSDRGNDRINIFDIHGSFKISMRLETSSEYPRAWPTDVFQDGTWLANAPAGGGRLSGAPGEIIRTGFSYLRFEADGRFRHQLTQIEGKPRVVNRVGNITHYPYVPLTAEPQLAAYGNELLVVQGPAPVIERRTASGEIAAIIRWAPAYERSVSAIWDRYKQEALTAIGDDERRRRYRHLYEQNLPLPREYPAAQRLVVDDDDNVWAQQYRLPWDSIPRWDVFDGEGQWLGTVETPPRVRVMHIGNDFVLGRHLDTLNVERIQLYELRKP